MVNIQDIINLENKKVNVSTKFGNFIGLLKSAEEDSSNYVIEIEKSDGSKQFIKICDVSIPADLINIVSIEEVMGGGRSVRKSSKKSVKKECPVKTSRTHKGKDGVVRRLYKRADDLFVRVKSKITGKLFYKKVKA